MFFITSSDESIVNRIIVFFNYFSLLVWISGSAGSQKVEKAELDGSKRVTLFTSTSLIDMKGLTIDLSTTTCVTFVMIN
jgi:hypothetical protein